MGAFVRTHTNGANAGVRETGGGRQEGGSGQVEGGGGPAVGGEDLSALLRGLREAGASQREAARGAEHGSVKRGRCGLRPAGTGPGRPRGRFAGKTSRLRAHSGVVLGTPDAPRDGETSHAAFGRWRVSRRVSASLEPRLAAGHRPSPAGAVPLSLPGVVGPPGGFALEPQFSPGVELPAAVHRPPAPRPPGPSQPGALLPVPAAAPRCLLPLPSPGPRFCPPPSLGRVGPAPG